MKKIKEKKVKEKSTKEGFFHKIRVEMKKVKWPSFKEMVKYTVATIVLVIIIALLFQVLNILISLIKGAI